MDESKSLAIIGKKRYARPAERAQILADWETSGTVMVGASPDQLVVEGDYDQTGGTLIFDIGTDGSGFDESTLLFEDASEVNIDYTKIEFDFLGSASPTDFYNDGLLNLNTFFLDSSGGPPPPTLNRRETLIGR